MPHGGTPNENYSPFEGGAGGCPVANMAWKPKDTPQAPSALSPLDRGDFQGRRRFDRAAPNFRKARPRWFTSSFSTG